MSTSGRWGPDPLDSRLSSVDAGHPLRGEDFKGKLNIVHDGDNLLAYLEGADDSVHSLPDLIVLDVRMQRFGGCEVLQRMQSDSRWAHIPVVIMSGVFDA